MPEIVHDAPPDPGRDIATLPKRVTPQTLGGLIKNHGRAHPAVLAASQQFLVNRLTEKICGLAEKYPAVTPEQAAQLHAAVVEAVGRAGWCG